MKRILFTFLLIAFLISGCAHLTTNDKAQLSKILVVHGRLDKYFGDRLKSAPISQKADLDSLNVYRNEIMNAKNEMKEAQKHKHQVFIQISNNLLNIDHYIFQAYKSGGSLDKDNVELMISDVRQDSTNMVPYLDRDKSGK